MAFLPLGEMWKMSAVRSAGSDPVQLEQAVRADRVLPGTISDGEEQRRFTGEFGAKIALASHSGAFHECDLAMKRTVKHGSNDISIALTRQNGSSTYF